MEKQEACRIIDNILFLVKGCEFIKPASKYHDYSDNVLSLIKDGLKMYIKPITTIIEYLKELETDQVKCNIETYIAQDIMNNILSIILEKVDTLTLDDCKEIYDDLMIINNNFFDKEEKQVVSLEDEIKLLYSERNGITINYLLKMDIINKLRKTGSPLLSNISGYNLQPSIHRIIINTNGRCNEVYRTIMDIYKEEKLSISDLLDRIEIRGLSVKQITSLYAKLFEDIDNDIVVQIKKDSIINLSFLEIYS